LVGQFNRGGAIALEPRGIGTKLSIVTDRAQLGFQTWLAGVDIEIS
jgi:hypothetical protein